MQENKRLAEYLNKAREVAQDGVIKSADLERIVRERLTHARYLSPVIRGWFLLTTPQGEGTTTLWYSSFWKFLKYYLEDRFGKEGYCLSAESSINLYVSQNTVPSQIIILTQKKTNITVDLPFETSLFLHKLHKPLNFPLEVEQHEGLNILPLGKALINLQRSYFVEQSFNAQMALKLLSPVDLSRELLNAGPPISMSNLVVGALNAMGSSEEADKIINDLNSLGIKVTPENPFAEKDIVFNNSIKTKKPAALRIEGLIPQMRSKVLEVFPEPKNVDRPEFGFLEKIHSQDSYHSLSIEGYQVTKELIERVASNNFKPEDNEKDHQQRDALAARGYYEAFLSVLESIEKVFQGVSPGDVFYEDVQTWYRSLFAPSVKAGILRPGDLAGYRNQPVYIQGSLHVPPNMSSLLDCMEVLENFLREEKSVAVRAVLGHFFFGYIHPYVDGNGRIARFLMNLNLVSGGYNWTVVRVKRRKKYLQALEAASCQYDIEPFANFILEEMKSSSKIEEDF